MTSRKRMAQKAFFTPDHGAELSRELAKEYLRQAGVTSVGQLAPDEQLKPIRDVLKISLKKRRKSSSRRIRGVKRLARK